MRLIDADTGAAADAGTQVCTVKMWDSRVFQQLAQPSLLSSSCQSTIHA